MVETLRDGRFVLLGTLGQGSQGETFDGVDKREGRAVAIKRFDLRGARTWKEADLAEREASVLQSLSHSKLPHYIDHFEHDGALYLVMEKIEGESLASMRRRGVVFGEADALRLLSDASEVLVYLQGRTPPVIHRDLKPGNVLRRPDGSFAFVDFGSVRAKLRPEGGSTVVGTFGYMAPEQFQGRAFAGSDVYGVAATALAMLTGQEPEVLPHKGLGLDVRASLGGRVSPALVAALGKMLDPDPDRRASGIAPLLSTLRSTPGSSTGERDRRSRAAPRGASRPSSGVPSWREAGAAAFEWQVQEIERQAEEYERRAAAGGRGSKGWRRGAAKLRRAAEKLRNASLRHASRHARWRAGRARWEARWSDRGGGERHRPPWPVGLVVSLVFAMGMVAVALATQVVVPAVLRMLSLFFARRALTQAALAVHRAGQDALLEMNRSRRWFGGNRDAHSEGQSETAPRSDSAPGGDGRVRVDPGDAVGRRVAEPGYDGALDESDEDEPTARGGTKARS